jgi:inosose dehydratase
VLASCELQLCLDTGHLTVAGCEPLEIARTAPTRIAHVHLKDVDTDLAASVRDGQLEYSEAVRRGMYTTLGCGDVDLAAIVCWLESSGYRGWYVPGVDRMLRPSRRDDGPVTGVRRSIEFLFGLQLMLLAPASETEHR